MKIAFDACYDPETNEMWELIRAGDDTILRGDTDIKPVVKKEIEKLIILGDMYSNRRYNLKGIWSLYKIESGQEYFKERGNVDNFREGIACRVNAMRNWYRTNIVVGVENYKKDVSVEFYTASGSKYILKKD
jgi:hypothetical protein